MRMRRPVRFAALILAASLLASCGGKAQPPTATTAPKPGQTAKAPTAIPLGPEPSYKVAAFYYSWYGNPEYDSGWNHWTQNGHLPPADIASDYYPALGPYSSNDPRVVEQHMQWLRQAGVGLIIVSWWGRGSEEERAVPLIMKTAAQYGIQVAFHIEPYNGRTANKLVDDVKYIYEQYGNSPAFFRTTATSTYSPDSKAKGVFFIWCTDSADNCGDQKVQANYWQKALDEIHALPQGALVIANTADATWIDGGHFDGLYNYATLHLQEQGGFAWARTLPPGALYVPSVIPGMSAKRVGYAESTYVARDNGQTYNDQWTAALNTGVQPFMVTITSFNEWHEGTMIEPAATGKNDGHSYNYEDFGSLAPDGYLTLTRQWIDRFQKAAVPATSRARIEIKTTSDWTTVNFASGGFWIQPQLVSASETATRSGFEAGDRFVLTQSIADANNSRSVEMVWDIQLAGLTPGGTLSLRIDRGNIGSTEVTLYNYISSTPVPAGSFTWAGVTGGRNSEVVTIAADKLLNSEP